VKFVDENTIVIDEVFPLYFVENHMRTSYEKLTKDKGFYHELYLGGWGNGHVALPWWHPWYNIIYDDIPVQVHGGLTYSQLDKSTSFWVIGFDTNHGGDDLNNRSFEWVKEETYRLLDQCLKPKIVQRILKLKKIQRKNP